VPKSRSRRTTAQLQFPLAEAPPRDGKRHRQRQGDQAHGHARNHVRDKLRPGILGRVSKEFGNHFLSSGPNTVSTINYTQRRRETPGDKTRRCCESVHAARCFSVKFPGLLALNSLRRAQKFSSPRRAGLLW